MNKGVLNKLTTHSSSGLKVRAGPAGLHFFSRATGVNVLIDEAKLPSNLWSTAPRQVSIALTNACDLECPHCYAPKNPAVLPFGQVTGWLADLDENGCIGVGFGGGEPTLYPRLAELCSYTVRETNLAVTMTTHAHRLSDRLIDELAGNLHFARVSMDGVGLTYEDIRCRSFNALLLRIKALSAIAPFGINFVVNSKTIGDLNAAVQLAADLGAAEFLLLPEEPVRGAGGIGAMSTRALQKWVDGYRGLVPLSVSEGRADGLPTCNPLSDETGLSAFAHIDASGILKETSYDLTGVPVREGGVMSALNHLKMLMQESNQ